MIPKHICHQESFDFTMAENGDGLKQSEKSRGGTYLVHPVY